MKLEEQVVSKPQSRQSFLVRGGAFSDNLLPMAQGLLYTGRARASLGRSSLGQFFRQCLSPHFLLWNLDFWYARSLGQNEKN